MLTAKDIINLNKKFDDGTLINKASLEFAISVQNKTKNWLEHLSYLVRSLLIDHVFKDGNKRVALAVILVYLEAHNLAYDPYKLDNLVLNIVTKNIKNQKQIGRMIKDAIR